MSGSPDGSETEKSELSSAPTADNYGSTPLKDKSATRFYVPFCGLVFYIMDFLGYFCSGLLREGLNVAIVAMVNQTTVTEVQTTNISGQCPKEPEIIGKRAGEFHWDRTQEGILLAAYYYGYIVTQVISIKTYCIGLFQRIINCYHPPCIGLPGCDRPIFLSLILYAQHNYVRYSSSVWDVLYKTLFLMRTLLKVGIEIFWNI